MKGGRWPRSQQFDGLLQAEGRVHFALIAETAHIMQAPLFLLVVFPIPLDASVAFRPNVEGCEEWRDAIAHIHACSHALTTNVLFATNRSLTIVLVVAWSSHATTKVRLSLNPNE